MDHCNYKEIIILKTFILKIINNLNYYKQYFKLSSKIKSQRFILDY